MASLDASKSPATPIFCSGKALAIFARRHGLSLKAAMAELLGHGIWPERFRRHYGLLSADAQIRLLDLPIFIAGCGGLGGELAARLARLGAGRMKLCDHDVFEESNLNRQQFCIEATLGKAKAPVAAAGLKAIASWGEYEGHVCRLEPANLEGLIADCAIVIDCLDSVAGKKMLEQAAARQGKAYLHGSVLHQEGFAFISEPARGALDRLYRKEFVASGAGSVLGHVVSGIASLMATLFVHWLSGRRLESPLLHCDFSAPELDRYDLP